MSEWISVKERMPDECSYVLCYVNDIVSGWVELLKYEGRPLRAFSYLYLDGMNSMGCDSRLISGPMA